MPLANYTTKVPVNRSVQLIQEMLSKAGVKALLFEYENGEQSALTFRIDRGEKQLGFRLPCDWRKTLVVLSNTQGVPRSLKRNDHAKRVAWRCVHDWLRAQLALVEIGAAEVEQVMLPYAITASGETLYEKIQGNGFLQLTNSHE